MHQYCYENCVKSFNNKMINKSYKNKNLWICSHDQQINKNIATTSV